MNILNGIREMQNLDSELAEKKRDQKNLNLSQDAREFLSKKSKEWYDTDQAQNRVVEHLIGYYQDHSDLTAEMQEVKQMLSQVVDEDPSPHRSVDSRETHKDQSPTPDDATSEDESSVARELEEMAKEGESISPDKHDLSVIKGARGLDRTAIIKSCMRDESTKDDWGKEDIRDLAVAEMGYGLNRARQIARETLLSLDSIPLQDMEDEWLPKRIDLEKESKEMQENGRISSPKQYERELSGSLEDYTGASLPVDVAYAGEQELAKGVLYAFIQLQKRYQNPGNAFEKKRVRRTMVEFIKRVDNDLFDIKVPERGGATLGISMSYEAHSDFEELVDERRDVA